MTELSIFELQASMTAGTQTALGITEWYLQRIAEIDQAGPRLNSVIEINPDALDIAACSTASPCCSKTTSTLPTSC